VETSYFNPPMGLYDILEQIIEKGYKPILAHPERYVYMDKHDYERLKQMGIELQMNIFSQAGMYGKTAQKKSQDLSERFFYNYQGSDLHRLAQLEMYLNK